MINENDKLAIDEAVEKFRSLMEGQLGRILAKRSSSFLIATFADSTLGHPSP